MNINVLPEHGDRKGVLREAEQLVCGDRNNQYGEPEQDFTRTASLWSELFADKLKQRFEAHDVALAMIALKLSRATWSPSKRDTWVDIAGYAACGFDVADIVDAQIVEEGE